MKDGKRREQMKKRKESREEVKILEIVKLE